MKMKRKPTSTVQPFKKYATRSKVRYTKAINDDFRGKEILSSKSMKIPHAATLYQSDIISLSDKEYITDNVIDFIIAIYNIRCLITVRDQGSSYLSLTII